MGDEAPEHRSDTYIAAVVRRWIETVVVELNLCPFARRELDADRVRIAVTDRRDEDGLLDALDRELARLAASPRIATTLLVHPQVLQDFEAYLDFLALAEGLLEVRGEVGVFQIASFHPDYVFAGADAEDAANFSNRTPFPLLHLLREESVERAVRDHPDAEGIPERNVARLDAMGRRALECLWESCFEAPESP